MCLQPNVRALQQEWSNEPMSKGTPQSAQVTSPGEDEFEAIGGPTLNLGCRCKQYDPCHRHTAACWSIWHAASVALELAVHGDRAPTSVVRTWAGEDVDESECWVQRPGERKAELPSLGWDAALETFRPFLSYSELGQMIAGRPSDMYDALASILGLDQITVVERRLN